MILACWRPQWHHTWIVEAAPKWHKVIYPGELPWASASSCCVAPHSFSATYRRPSVEAPPSASRRPPAKGTVCSEKRTFFLVNHRGAQHAPVLWPSFTFSRKLQSGFKLPSTCTCQSHGFYCRWWRGQSSWWATQGSVRCRLLTDPCLAAHGCHLSMSGL
jgi:hypothetical protein